jgi:hypothetical protein
VAETANCAIFGKNANKATIVFLATVTSSVVVSIFPVAMGCETGLKQTSIAVVTAPSARIVRCAEAQMIAFLHFVSSRRKRELSSLRKKGAASARGNSARGNIDARHEKLVLMDF